MSIKDIQPLYDVMIRLFVASMSNIKISTQILGHILNIPIGTMREVIDTCPLPSLAKLVRGGHRGLEEFIVQSNFMSVIDRGLAVIDIADEKIWCKYGITLNPDRSLLIREVEKVLENVGKLQGSNIKKGAIIKSGDTKAYRCLWFVKDIMNSEYYNIAQEAIKKSPQKKVSMMPLITQNRPREINVVPTKYNLMSFISEIQELITSKEQYIATIKRLEDKINREYPALISQKEAEKAAAERETDRLKERVKILSRTCEDQKTEIHNLKRHPKFAGYIKINEITKGDKNAN